MSSYRKPEIQNDLPKINRVKLICQKKIHQNFDQKSLTLLIIALNHYNLLWLHLK